MTIRTRGGSFQVDVVFNGKRFRRNASTEAEAKSLHALAEDCLKRGVPVSQGNAGASSIRTMQDLLERTAQRHWKGSKNERNALANAQAVVNALGQDTHPSAITASSIDHLIELFRQKNNSDATINRKLAALSKMLGFALDRGVITSKPKIDRLTETEKRIRWYSKEEEKMFLNYLRQTGQEDFHDLVVFLFDTGCRAAEAGRARWEDIDDVYFRVWESKSGKSRAIPLTSRLKDLLDRRKSEAQSDLVFPGWLDRSGSSCKMSKTWHDMREGVGLRDESAVLHSCRHTFASRLVQHGVPLRSVQTLLGHSSISTTQRYSHLAPSNLIDAVATLDRVT